MKKRFLLLFLTIVSVVCLAFGLSACSGDNGGGSSNSGNNSKQFTVTLDVNGGDALTSTTQTVTYGERYTLAVPTRDGYTFNGWYYGDTQLTDTSGNSLSTWFASEDRTLTANWIYYTLTVISDNTTGGEVSAYSDTKVTVGKSVTITATAKEGYAFVGWYSNNELLDDSDSYTFTMPSESITITGKFVTEAEAAFMNFEYISVTDSTYKITGIKDNTVTNIVVPDSVVSISKGAFSGCSNLKSITLPFVGGGDGATEDDSHLFGYIFGSSNYNIPNNLTSVTITGGDVSCGAFYDCANIESITLPETVTTIDDETFSCCINLESVNIPDGVTYIGKEAFYLCYALTSIDLPDGVTSIGDYAFYHCSSLISITFPDSLTTIGDYAFYECSALRSVTLGSDLTSVGSNAFYGCTKLIEICNLSSLEIVAGNGDYGDVAYYALNVLTETSEVNHFIEQGDYSFYYNNINYYLIEYNGTDTSITLPDLTVNGSSVEYGISSNAFLNSDLISVEMPDNVTSIGESAFSGCSSLVSVTLGSNLTSIGWWAFAHCTSLTNITLPESLTSIGDYAFSNCYKLIEVCNLSSLEITIGSWNNGNVGYYAKNIYNATSGESKITAQNDCLFYNDNGNYYLIAYIGADTEVTLPEFKLNGSSVEYGIYNYAFYYNEKITGLTMPDSVTSIGGRAFYYCTSLTSVDMGNGVTTIDDYAFYYCYYINSLTMSEALTSIGKDAFNYCYSLKSITIPKNVTNIGNEAFSGCKALTEINFNATAMENLSEDSDVFYDVGRYYNGITLTIGADVTVIPAYLFYAYSNYSSEYTPTIVSIVFAEGSVCTKIGSYAFWNCKYLTTITIPESLTTISTYAFYNCTALTEINFNATAMEDLVSFNHVFYNAGQNGDGITVNIGANVTCIPAHLFHHNSSGENAAKIVNIVFAENGVCESIGDSAFVHSSITSIIIPDTVKTIGDSAFANSALLTSVTIGSNVTTIYTLAFYGCSQLNSVTFNNTSGWYVDNTVNTSNSIPVDVSNISANATYLTSTYNAYYWYRSEN